MAVKSSSALIEAFLDCHADGHQWKHLKGAVDPMNAGPGLRPPGWMQGGCVGRRSTCNSCAGERIRWYALGSGEVENKYRMQDGYYHKRSAPDDYAPSRADYRRDLVKTLFADFEAAVSRGRRQAVAS